MTAARRLLAAVGLSVVLTAGAAPPAAGDDSPVESAPAPTADEAHDTADEGPDEVEPTEIERVFDTHADPVDLPAGIRAPGARRTDGATVKVASGDPAAEDAVQRGVEQLGLEPAYVRGVREGLEKLFERDYKGTRAHFRALDGAFPGTGIAAAVDVIVWQAMMLENFDFRYESQWETANDRAQEQLQAALEQPGREGWEHFLMAGILGIEAIHTMRRHKYLPALRTALDAMGQAGHARKAAPAFTDLLLADGMYNYWRTVITQSSRMLPDFGDHRVAGIEHMVQVEREGVFLSRPATLSLAFSYIEEGKLRMAEKACRRNARDYPDNVINNLVLGQVLTYRRQYDEALAVFDRVLAVDPTNTRVRYWRAVALLRSGHSPEAIEELRAFLDADYLEEHHRAAGHYRMGQAEYRNKRYASAEDQYKQAIKLSGHKGAKRALDRMKKMRRDGRITY